jgi:hypothetical protein
MRIAVLLAYTALVAIPATAATKPSPYKRTAICSASAIAVTYDIQQVVIETEPVRNYSGRIIGSRLAVWRSRYWSGGEILEAIVGIDRPWLSYYPAVCHTGSSSAG